MQEQAVLIAMATGIVGGLIALPIILKFWPKTGKMGINLAPVKCPKCAATAPQFRKPTSMRQMLWGGWTCPRCGCEMDKYGNRIEA